MNCFIVGFLLLALFGIATASPDNGGGKPAALPKSTQPKAPAAPKNPGSGSAPSASPSGSLPNSSTGVPAAAGMPVPDPVPATPPATRAPAMRRPDDFFDTTIPYAIDSAGPRFTFDLWSRDNLNGAHGDTFMDKLAEHGMYESFLQLMEATGLPSAYKIFAEDYVARQMGPRHQQMRKLYNDQLAAEEQFFLERYTDLLGLPAKSVQADWASMSNNIQKHWDKVVGKAQDTFRRQSTASYQKIMNGATVVCTLAAAKGKNKKRKNADENEDDGKKKSKTKNSGKKKSAKKKYTWDSDDDEDEDEEEE